MSDDIRIMKVTGDITKCPICNEELVDYHINSRSENTPDIINMKYVIGRSCINEKCTYAGRIYPDRVFNVIRALGEQNAIEDNLPRLWEPVVNAVEASIRHDVKIPDDIWKVFIKHERERLYAKYDREYPNNHLRRDMNVIYYFVANNEIVWGLN